MFRILNKKMNKKDRRIRNLEVMVRNRDKLIENQQKQIENLAKIIEFKNKVIESQTDELIRRNQKRLDLENNIELLINNLSSQKKKMLGL